MIITAVIFITQIISNTNDFLRFESHVEIRMKNSIYETFRMPSFRLCFHSSLIYNHNESKQYMNLDSILNNMNISRIKKWINCSIFVESQEFIDKKSSICDSSKNISVIEIILGDEFDLNNNRYECFVINDKNLVHSNLLTY